MVCDRAHSRLPRHVADDERFARIARAATPDETYHQAKGLQPQLIIIDGHSDANDVLDVVAPARASGRSRVIAVRTGQRTDASPEQLRDAGTTVLVKKSDRQNLLNACATEVDPDLPF